MAEVAAQFPVDRYATHVSLSDTDAFAVLYWGAPLGWAQLGYESLMRSVGHPMQEMLDQDWGTPVVNMVVDYVVPLHLGDRIDVETSIVEVGNRSVKVESRIFKHGELAVRVARVQVAARRAGGAAALPGWLRALGPARRTTGAGG